MLRVLIFTLIGCFTWRAAAQNRISADAFYMQGFQSHTLHIYQAPISTYTSPGFAAHLNYSYRIAHPAIEVLAGAGVQQLYISGRYGPEAFTITTTRMDLLLAGRFHFAEKWAAGLGLNMENNRPFEDFRIKATDNFRYNLLVELLYSVNDKLHLMARYYHGLYPLVDVYLLSNPGQKLGLGLHYKIFDL